MGLGRRLASQSALIFLARIGGAGVVFLAQAAMARAWGAAVLGDYLILVSAANLIAVVMPLGFQTIAPYFAAEYRARSEGRNLRAFLLRAYGHVAAGGVVLVILGTVIGQVGGPVADTLAAHWPAACLLTLATAVVFVNGAVLVGLKRPLAAFLADALFRPLLLIGGFGLALALDPANGLDRLLWVLSGGFAVIAALHLAYVLGTALKVPVLTPANPAEQRRWWRFAMPWVIIGLATDFFFDLDLLLLAGHMSREDLAVFGVCARVFSLVSFGVAAVYAVTLPDVFEAEAQKDRAMFHRRIGDANLVASGLALLLTAGVALAAPLVLILFGNAFLAGALPLAVLCTALLVRAVMGPASLVLSIHDRPYASLPAVGLGLVALILGNWLMVPELGLLGAALAALLAITLWSVALWGTAYRLAGVDVSVWPRVKGLIAETRLRRGDV